MQYFKIKKVVTEHTTLSLVYDESDTVFKYDEIDEYEYWGVQTENVNFLTKQYAECEAIELTFAEIKPVLENCPMMKNINERIEKEIAKKYTVAQELGLTNGDHNSQEYITYRNYVDECKAKFHQLKIDSGLVEA
jgi:hypothetical protein